MNLQRTSPWNLICVFFVSSLFLYGCTASVLPKRLTTSQQASLEGVHFNVSVGVVPIYPSGSVFGTERLTRNLRETGLFDVVKANEEFLKNPDLLLIIDDKYANDAPMPIATFLTLGIIPTFVDQQYGYAFWLYAPSRPEEKIYIDYLFEGQYVIGGLGSLLNVSPDWTKDGVKNNRRFLDQFALAIAEQASAIRKLVDAEY